MKTLLIVISALMLFVGTVSGDYEDGNYSALYIVNEKYDAYGPVGPNGWGGVDITLIENTAVSTGGDSYDRSCGREVPFEFGICSYYKGSLFRHRGK